MQQVKRPLNYNIGAGAGEQYDHQYQLQTLGMRIRKAVSEGYQRHDNMFVASQASRQYEQEQQQQQQSRTQTFQRVPLPSNVVVPPMLSNSSTTFGSSFEEWENNLDNRLKTIDSVLTNSNGALCKRRFDAVDNDW